MIFIGIKDGKIWDICSELIYKRDDDSLLDKDYIKIDIGTFDYVIGDTWDFDNNVSLMDSPRRSLPPEKTALELRIEELEAKNQEIIDRLNELESIKG